MIRRCQVRTLLRFHQLLSGSLPCYVKFIFYQTESKIFGWFGSAGYASEPGIYLALQIYLFVSKTFIFCEVTLCQPQMCMLAIILIEVALISRLFILKFDI